MNGQQGARSLLFIVLALGAGLLLVWAGLQAPLEDVLIPTPQGTAEQFVNAMAAHRYTGALNQLSGGVQQQVTWKDLRAVMEQIEQSPRGGIADAQEQESQINGDRATAAVKVKYQNLEEETLQFALKKENRVWRVENWNALR